MAVSSTPSEVTHPAPQRHKAGWLRLTLGLVGAPFAWVTETTLSYILSSSACYPGRAPLAASQWHWLLPALLALTLACLAVGCLSLFIAWQSWRRVRYEAKSARDKPLELSDGRTSFMSMVGLMANGIFLTGILISGCVMLFASNHHSCI